MHLVLCRLNTDVKILGASTLVAAGYVSVYLCVHPAGWRKSSHQCAEDGNLVYQVVPLMMEYWEPSRMGISEHRSHCTIQVIRFM